MRSSDGYFQMALVTVWSRHGMVRGRPTLTETTRPLMEFQGEIALAHVTRLANGLQVRMYH